MSKYKGNTVAVIGLSVEGQDSVKFFVQEGATVICCDRRTKEELGSIYDKLCQYRVKFQLGKGYLDRLITYDMIVRTPGMLPTLPALVAARKAGKKVTSLTQIFLEECKAAVIGITGTKGKGTTSTLIYTMLTQEGKTVFLGGNVGVPLLSRVREMKQSDWVVLELSSFQLEDVTISPHIAVVLRITQDHLANYDRLATNFHATREAYIAAKTPIVRFQKSQDHAVLLRDDPVSSSFASLTAANVHYYSRTNPSAEAYVQDHTVMLRWEGSLHRICDASEIKLRGEHNLENIAAASLAAALAGVPLDAIRVGAKAFEGLEHRLEFVRTAGGVSYFNDSFSTVPETAVAAIQSFDEPIILIAGGSEKGSDFTQLGEAVASSRVKVLIAIGDMTQRIVDAAKKAGFSGTVITGCRSMSEIVATAAAHAASGDIVLLSPACASFDMFKNYKERGKQFKHEVSLL